MATILVTRPEADASRSAARLRELGHEVIVSPVLVVSPVEAPAPGSQIDATIVASANVAGYMGRDDVRGALSQKPVFAVGDRAAAGIRDLGYPDVRSAAGASADLAELAIRAVTPPARLLAPVGKAHRAEAFDILRARGFEVEPVVVYDAAPAEQLSTEAVAGLRYDVIDAVLHYSPRSAQIFVELAQRGDGGDRLARLHHVCLSDDVADALPEDLRSRATIAEAPNEDALIAALDAALSETSKGQGRLASGVAKPRRTPRQRAPRMIDATGARVAEELAEHAKRIAHSQREPSSPPEADIVAPIAPAVSLEKPNIELAAAGALKVPAEPVAARDVESAEEQAPQPAAHARPIDERAPSARPSLSESPPSPPPRKQGWSPLSLLFGGVAGAMAGAAAALLVAPRPTVREYDIQALEARLQTLAPRSELAAAQQRIEALPGAIDGGRNALRTEIDTLGKRIDSLAASVPAPGAPQTSMPGPDAARRIDDVKQSVDGVTSRLQALEQKSSNLERAVAARPGGATAIDPAARRHALSMSVSSALALGAPYATELKALERDDVADAIAALRPFASGGAPSPSSLADEFKALVPRLVEPAPEEKSSLSDRLVSSMRGLVRVRPIGDAAGDDVASLVARVEAALGPGALDRALEAFDKLPEPQRALASSFGARLKQRVEASAAARKLSDASTRALTAEQK